MRTRWIVLACALAGLLALPVGAYAGAFAYLILTRPSLASAIEGCPSHAFPVHPGSKLSHFAEITVGTDHGMTTGCWATYDEPASNSVQDAFNFYTNPSDHPGWTLVEAYPDAGYAAFTSTTVRGLRADVGIDKIKRYFVAGPATVTVAISVCLCDPRTMAQ